MPASKKIQALPKHAMENGILLSKLLKENLVIWVEKDYSGRFNGLNLHVKITFDCKTVTEDYIPLSELQD